MRISAMLGTVDKHLAGWKQKPRDATGNQGDRDRRVL